MKTFKKLGILASMFLALNSANAQIKGNVSTKFSSHCVFSMLGAVAGKGPHINNVLTLGVNIPKTNQGNISGYYWLNTDLGDRMDKKTNTYNECDYGIVYTQPITEKVLATGSLDRYVFEGEKVNASSLSLGYNGKPVDVNLSLYHIFKNKSSESGSSLVGKISKNIPLVKNVTFQPSVYGVYANNFFGPNNGHTATVLNGALSYNKGNVTVTGALGKQWKGNPKNPQSPSIHDQLFGSLGLDVAFSI